MTDRTRKTPGKNLVAYCGLYGLLLLDILDNGPHPDSYGF